MEFETMQNKKQFQFHPAGEDGRSTDFAVIPRHMVEDADKINAARPWNRVVAFGIAARVAKALFDEGVRLFAPKRGRLRDNSFEGDDGDVITYDIVCREFKGKEAAKLHKTLSKDAAKVPAG